jgi:hypothetical protein
MSQSVVAMGWRRLIAGARRGSGHCDKCLAQEYVEFLPYRWKDPDSGAARQVSGDQLYARGLPAGAGV